MKLLALDFGEKRIGVAIGDSKIGVAAARNFLANNQKVFENLAELVEREEVKKIIVGLPRGFSRETQQTKAAREFVKKMKNKIPVEIEFADERFTSRIAKMNLQTSGKSSREQKGWVDSEAARIILQEYLDVNFLPTAD